MKTSGIIGAIVIILAIGGVGLWLNKTNMMPQQKTNDTYDSLIQVFLPLPNQQVASPLKVSGKAVGNWYFEASFPIMILDANGEKLGVVPAQAQSGWMTTEFVPFEATLTFDKPTTKTGTLVLMKDNPSGLPEYDNSISIPVSF